MEPTEPPECSRPLRVALYQRGTRHGGPPDVVAAILRDRGHAVEQIEDGAPPPDAEVVLLLRNARWYPELCRELVRTPASDRPLVAIWHREPVPPPRASGLSRPGLSHREIGKIVLRDRRITDVYSNVAWLRRLRRAGVPDVLVASTLARQEYLAEHAFEAEWAPLGYSPGDGRDMGLERDIDVFFVGALDIPRRRRRLRALRRRGVDVMAIGDWNNPTYFGGSRNRLLNRSKILVNVTRHAGDLADARFILGMANGALVVSEPVYRPQPFEPGRHFVSATIDEMPEAIDHYLRHEDERLAITAEANRFVVEDHTMSAAVGRVLGFVQAALERR